MQEEIKVYGHYYKKFRLFGMRKITVHEICEDGLVRFVFGHVSPGEAEMLNKMECFLCNVISDISDEEKEAVDRKEKEKKMQSAERKRLEREAAKEKTQRIENFIDQMAEKGRDVSEVTASWLTEEQMKEMLLEADQVVEEPEEGFMLF